MEARAYATPTVAPWAEIVPGATRKTVDDLLSVPDDGRQYEVVEGVLVSMAGSGFEATDIAMRLGSRLRVFADDHGLGAVTGADGVYDFAGAGQADTGLIPDVGFLSAAHLPLAHPERAIPFAPDLAVEVASPTQRHPEMAAKACRYLAGGTGLVWVVWPRYRQVDVWHPGDTDTPFATLTMGDTLDGEDVVPGFSYPIARLFS